MQDSQDKSRLRDVHRGFPLVQPRPPIVDIPPTLTASATWSVLSRRAFCYIGRHHVRKVEPCPPAHSSKVRLPAIPVRRGKVRDVYDFGDRLLIVATDRISAFDWVLPTGIPDKGRVLTQMSEFWFGLLGAPNHLLSMDPDDVPLPGRGRPRRAGRAQHGRPQDDGRSHRVRRPRLSVGIGLEGISEAGRGVRHPAAGGLARKRPAPRADLHPGDQGRSGARRQHSVRADVRDRRRDTRPTSCAAAASTSTPGPPSTPRPGASSSPTRSSNSATAAARSS